MPEFPLNELLAMVIFICLMEVAIVAVLYISKCQERDDQFDVYDED